MDKSISGHSIGTMAHGNVVDHIADSIGTTRSGTRISALLLYTGQISGTLRTKNTLGSARHIGISLIVGHTFTFALIRTDSIAAAWTGVAWIAGLFTGWWGCKRVLVLVPHMELYTENSYVVPGGRPGMHRPHSRVGKRNWERD